MKVSIIMGVYNSEKTIERSINSILNQTFKDWIFIICDDGSSDNTFEILKKYENKYPSKFKILKNDKNRGLTYSLNHCLKYVSTEFVARMDGDDISLPERLSKQVKFLDAHSEYGFVGTSIERFDENGVWKRCKSIEEPQKNIFYSSTGFVHPTILIRKSILDKVNGYNDIWYTKRCEDYDLWMRLYSEGFKGYNIQEILFQYYEGKDSFPKRKYRYRFGEAVTRAIGYFKLRMYPKGIIYVFKPLISGLLPKKIVIFLHRKID